MLFDKKDFLSLFISSRKENNRSTGTNANFNFLNQALFVFCHYIITHILFFPNSLKVCLEKGCLLKLSDDDLDSWVHQMEIVSTKKEKNKKKRKTNL